ncbi:MAG: recombination protein RmuC [Alphaproteobacteria bacterium]|nr:recombination protein RmuC [Alphaproteobacteria bacterium]
MNLLEIILGLGGGLVVGGLIVYGIMVGRTRELATRLEMQDLSKNQFAETFAALSAEALNKNNQQFLTLANENLQRFHQKADASLTEKHLAISQLIQPVNESLQKMDSKIAEIELKREGAYGELKTLVNAMKDQHVLLHTQTASLAQALRAPTSRGQWGEMQLKRVLDFSGLHEGIHYSRQASSQSNDKGIRPDMLVHLPPNKVLLIDAKVPMQNYLSAMQPDVSESDRNILLTRHSTDLKNHIKVLSGKEYTQGFDSFDWVIMFVPLDGLIQSALEKQPDLIEHAWNRNVILATPTNLLGLMRTVSYAHDQFKVNENAKEIAKIGETLYKRVSIFANHITSMGKSLNGALDHYNKAVGSLERNVLSTLREVKTLGIASGEEELPVMKAIEDTPRKLTAPELIAEETDA